MVVTTLHLPEHIVQYLRRQVDSGAFASEEAVITDAVEQAMEPADPWGDEGTQEALAQVARGEVVTVTDIDAMLRELQKQARDQTRRGVPIPDDVKYEG